MCGDKTINKIDNAKLLYSKMPTTVKASIWYTACSILLTGVGFFTTPFFARILPTNEYGLFLIMGSYMKIILIFSTWELSLGAYQKGIFKYKDDEPLLTWCVIVFENILTIMIFALIIIFWHPFSDITGYSAQVTAVTFLYLLFLPAYSCWTIRKKNKYDYKPDITCTILFKIISIITPLLACIYIKKTAEIRYIYECITYILVYSAFYIKSIKWKEFFKNLSTVKEYFLFFLRVQPPIVIYSLSYMILGQADRLMIGKYVDNASAGIYSIAYTVASMASVFQGAATTVLVPWTYANLKNKTYENIRNKIKEVLILTALIYVFFILCSPEAIIILFPEAYHESIWCIPPIAVGTFFLFVQSLFVNVEIYLEQTKYIAIIAIVCSCLNIALNYFGIELFGYIACAYTTLICYICFAIGHGYFSNRMARKCLESKEVYDTKGIICISIGVLILMVVITMLYSFPIVRYSLIVVLAVVLILRRDKLVRMYHEFKKNI